MVIAAMGSWAAGAVASLAVRVACVLSSCAEAEANKIINAARVGALLRLIKAPNCMSTMVIAAMRAARRSAARGLAVPVEPHLCTYRMAS
jgi:hypothetical protein